MNKELQSSLFLDNVLSLPQTIIQRRIKELQQELTAALAAKIGSSEEKAIHQACRLMGEKIGLAFEKNLAKFELYSKRNIFDSPKHSSANMSQASASSASDKENSTAQLESLRQQYQSVRNSYNDKMRVKMELAALLRDMKAAHFQYQLGAQVMDEYNIASLQECMLALEQQRATLVALCHRANDLTSFLHKISSGHGAGANISTTVSASASRIDEISAGTAADMSLLTHSIRGGNIK